MCNFIFTLRRVIAPGIGRNALLHVFCSSGEWVLERMALCHVVA